MVFVRDFRKEFYDVVSGQRVLVLVGMDVDALCACKIIQTLFQCDHVMYTIVPVMGRGDLERAFMENSDQLQYVLLLNCGAQIDLVEVLQPPDNIIFFVCDSHQPVDVHNIYNQVQVQLLMKQEELEDIPDFASVFREENSSDEDSGNDSDESSGKPRRMDERTLEKRREKRLWAEKRQKVLYEYAQFSGYGTSSAFLMFELAWKMSKDNNDLLWLAILGVTEQFTHSKIDRDKYIEDIGNLQGHVSRHNHRPEGDDNALSVDSLKLAFEQELQLVLYRHWSLFESILHTPNIACKFRVWTLKGKKRLQEFLADMGLPLYQCKQLYNSMDIIHRDTVRDMIQQNMEKYGFRESDLFLPSFHAQFGFRHKFCALDYILACEAVLEFTDKTKTPSDNFLVGLDILNRMNTVGLEKSIESSKLQQQAVCNQMQTFLETNTIMSAGPFLYGFAAEGTPDSKFFAHPICLLRLAQFTLQAYCSTSKSKRASQLPLVLGAPLDREIATTLVVGIPPTSDTSCKNFFGKAFEQAAISTNARTIQDYFDTNIIELKTEDKAKFFDSLIALLN